MLTAEDIEAAGGKPVDGSDRKYWFILGHDDKPSELWHDNAILNIDGVNRFTKERILYYPYIDAVLVWDTIRAALTCKNGLIKAGSFKPIYGSDGKPVTELDWDIGLFDTYDGKTHNAMQVLLKEDGSYLITEELFNKGSLNKPQIAGDNIYLTDKENTQVFNIETLKQTAVPNSGSFTDSRDGKTYRTVRIGSQVWMAENLAFKHKGARSYENKAANAKKYGLLYDWETAQKSVPAGWHLPTNDEWQALVNLAGGDSYAGKHLKATVGWNEGGGGTDDFGFSALPGGDRNTSGTFDDVGYYGDWWTATEYDASSAYYWNMFYNIDYVDLNYNDKTNLVSVRCVKD